MNVNYIWTVDTEATEQVLFTNHASNDFGLDCSLGFQWRPLLTDNVILTAGAGFLVPGKVTKISIGRIHGRCRDFRGRPRVMWMIFCIAEFLR